MINNTHGLCLLIFLLICGLLGTGCQSKSSTGNNGEDASPLSSDSVIDDSVSADDSVDSNDMDSDTDNHLDASPELIANLQDYDGLVISLDVAYGDIFLGLETHIYRSPITDTTSLNDAQNRFYAIPGDSKNVIFEPDATYMKMWTPDVVRYDRASGEFESFRLPDELAKYAGVMTADKDRFYFTTTGCEAIVSVKRDGTDPLVCKQERTGYIAGYASIAVGDEFIYCSGGADGSTDGRIYRCHKNREEQLALFATITDAEEILAYYAGPMRVINGYLYYLTSHTSKASSLHRLSRVHEQTGDLEVLATIRNIEGEMEGGSPGYRLLYDEARHSLYWMFTGVTQIARYNMDTQSLETKDLRALTGQLAVFPLAQDDDYLYWPTLPPPLSVYRIPKF